MLQGSHSSVVRASTANVGGLGFDSQGLPKFFPSVCFYSDLPPVAYQQFLLPVVVIRIVTKIIMVSYRGEHPGISLPHPPPQIEVLYGAGSPF